MKATLRLLLVTVLLSVTPVFALPIQTADTITADGKIWAQVDLFAGLSWDTIDVVCPGGACSGGTLNGWDMGGWTWASADDVNSLLNTYLTLGGFSGGDLLGPGPDGVFPAPNWDNPAATAFFDDDWRPTRIQFTPLERSIQGWTASSTTSMVGNTVGYQARVRDRILPQDGSFTNFDTFTTSDTASSDTINPYVGGWFYKPVGCGGGSPAVVQASCTGADCAQFKSAAVAVNLPATLWLLAVGLSVLLSTRARARSAQ